MKTVLTGLFGIACVMYTNLCFYGWMAGYDSFLQMF